MSLLKSHSFIGHVVVGCSFDSIPFCVFFYFHLTDDTCDLSNAIYRRLNPCAAPLGDGLSGRLAGPIPNTGYEPEFCIDVSGLRRLSADYDSVASRSGIKETCADMDRETVVSSLFESVSKEKRDRDQNVVQTSRDKQNLHKILE